MHAAPIALTLAALASPALFTAGQDRGADPAPQDAPTEAPAEMPADADQDTPAPKVSTDLAGDGDPTTADRAQLEAEYFAIMDFDENGWISFREGEESLSMTRTSFRQYDTDQDGRITPDEFGARYDELLDRTGGFPKPRAQGPPPKLGPEPVPVTPGNLDAILGTLPPAPAPTVTPESFVNQYDLNVDGRLSGLELTEASRALGFGGLNGNAVMPLIDTNGSGFVEPAELSQVLADLGLLGTAGTLPNEPKARSVEELFGHAEPRKLSPGAAPLPPHIAGPVRPFRRLDLDDDGALELADFDGLAISAHPRVSPGAVIATLDLDGDGVLSPDEFAAAFED